MEFQTNDGLFLLKFRNIETFILTFNHLFSLQISKTNWQKCERCSRKSTLKEFSSYSLIFHKSIDLSEWVSIASQWYKWGDAIPSLISDHRKLLLKWSDEIPSPPAPPSTSKNHHQLPWTPSTYSMMVLDNNHLELVSLGSLPFALFLLPRQLNLSA